MQWFAFTSLVPTNNRGKPMPMTKLGYPHEIKMASKSKISKSIDWKKKTFLFDLRTVADHCMDLGSCFNMYAHQTIVFAIVSWCLMQHIVFINCRYLFILIIIAKTYQFIIAIYYAMNYPPCVCADMAVCKFIYRFLLRLSEKIKLKFAHCFNYCNDCGS